MKRIILLVFFLTVALGAYTQDFPVYNQYFNNPYLLNPAFVGSSGYIEAGLTHRRQWVGIEDAPVASSLTLQYPTRKNVSLGLGVHSQSIVLLNKASALATFGYQVVLGEAHLLRFGLSAGFGNYYLNQKGLNDGNLNDPTVQKALNTNYFYDGQFGFVYSIKGINLGFAVPNLFNTKTFTQDNFNDVRFAELKYNMISASYRFDIIPNTLSFEPYIIYRMGNEVKEQWEGLGTVYIKNLVWIGGSYREQFGPSAFAGLSIKNFKLGYAFELPSSSLSKLSKGSHEIQLNIKFGKNRRQPPQRKLASEEEKKLKDKEENESEDKSLAKNQKAETKSSTPTTSQTSKTSTPVNKETTKTVSPTIASKPTTIKAEEKKPSTTTSSNTYTKAPVAEKKPTSTYSQPSTSNTTKPKAEEGKTVVKEKPVVLEAKKSTNPLELKEGNYVITGSFKVAANAENFKKQIKKLGYVGYSGYSSKSESYYVYTFKSANIEEARFRRDQLRKLQSFKNAWVLTVE